jgi:carboxyl-terminal processing protease
MTPKEYHMLMEQMQNESFGGIGIYIELDKEHDETLTVVEPLEGTPAQKAGLLSGDQIIKINGKPTKGITLDIATAQIRGPVSSPVVLTIARPGVPGLKDYSIERAQIAANSVSRKMMGQIGYIRLRMFGAKTGQELQEALTYVSSQHAKGIILDLRNNGGGYINAAVDVCSHFVGNGSLVTYTTDRRERRRDYSSIGHDINHLPMVLMINNFSASASEITAGCLKDYGRATLVGVKSFGKGSVQQLYPLPNGAALKVTIAHFFTPQGNKIHKIGVTPNVSVEMEPRMVGRDGKDVQLQKAVEALTATLSKAP